VEILLNLYAWVLQVAINYFFLCSWPVYPLSFLSAMTFTLYLYPPCTATYPRPDFYS
jgi:hypothetical protein